MWTLSEPKNDRREEKGCYDRTTTKRMDFDHGQGNDDFLRGVSSWRYSSSLPSKGRPIDQSWEQKDAPISTDFTPWSRNRLASVLSEFWNILYHGTCADRQWPRSGYQLW
jgi:hypothetical protein